MLTIVSSKLTGTPGPSGWTQIHEFAPQDFETLKLRGSLFTVVSTNSASLDNELYTRFHEEYYGDLDSKPFNALKNAIQKVANEFEKTWGATEIVATTFVSGVIYSAAIGGSRVMILRNGSLGSILESNSDQVIVASGFPKAGDVIFSATKSFFEKIPYSVIKGALSRTNPTESMESFGPMISGFTNQDNIGAVIIKFEEKKNISLIENIINKFPKKNIYLKREPVEQVSPQSKKLTFFVAAILLFLLAVSIGFGIHQKNLIDLKSKYQGILQAAGNEVDQAISLASTDSGKRRELFTDSEQKLTQIEAMKVKDSKIDTLKQKIDASRAAVLGEYEVLPQMFLDLTLLSSGFKGDTISFSGGNIYILDKSGQRIVSVNISSKKSLVVAGPSVLNSVISLAAYEKSVYVLENDGIYEVDSGRSNKVIDKTWSGDAFIMAFAGNIYVMDKSEGDIYRYQGVGSTFPNKENWLSKSTNVNFADVGQITIDGAIYALYPNSKILKFSQGSPQNFKLSGVVPEIGSIDAIYANSDNQYLYLLDKAGSRVVITDKKGAYKAQYTDPLISSATNLVASEADKKVILLTGDKLYSIDLQNL